MKPNQEQWEEEYSRRFFDHFDDGSKHPSVEPYYQIKSFITLLLSQRERETAERVIAEIPDEVDKECSYSEGGEDTETVYLITVKQQLRQQFGLRRKGKGMKKYIDYKGYWEPILVDKHPSFLPELIEIPDDLVARYEKAIAEIEEVWEKLADLIP